MLRYCGLEEQKADIIADSCINAKERLENFVAFAVKAETETKLQDRLNRLLATDLFIWPRKATNEGKMTN